MLVATLQDMFDGIKKIIASTAILGFRTDKLNKDYVVWFSVIG